MSISVRELNIVDEHWEDESEEELGPERCQIHIGGESLEALAFYLGYLGFDFEVHEPVEVGEHLRRLAEHLTRAASRTTGAVP